MGEVTWIVDGDTIEVEGPGGDTTVRLVAVNAPEADECYAEPGVDHLVDTLKGQEVILEVAGEDQFGRILAHVFAGDRHVNLELVELGLAIAASPGEDDPHGEAILSAEETAHQGGRGLWSPRACGSQGPLPQVSIEPGRSEFDPPGPDEANLAAELLTLVNEGTETVDMTGWVLRDESSRHRFVFGDVVMGGGESLVVTSADNGAVGNWDPGDGPVWNNGGDMALLQDPLGTVVARWRY